MSIPQVQAVTVADRGADRFPIGSVGSITRGAAG
jgi:hypothetical protein